MNNQKSLHELRLLAKEDKLPIQVVVRRFGQYKAFVFKTLSEARRSFLELDPNNNNDKFTWGTRGVVHLQIDDSIVEKDALRFEDWETNDAFSI